MFVESPNLFGHVLVSELLFETPLPFSAESLSLLAVIDQVNQGCRKLLAVSCWDQLAGDIADHHFAGSINVIADRWFAGNQCLRQGSREAFTSDLIRQVPCYAFTSMPLILR